MALVIPQEKITGEGAIKEFEKNFSGKG